MSKRLFVAINATSPLIETFPPIYKKLRISADKKEMLIKWVPPENFHVTVSFLGSRNEVETEKIEDILKKICAQFSPFELKVSDMGAFASETEARVLWLGVQNKKYLGEFKEALDSELAAGQLLAPQVREFVPHLAFARLRNPKSVKDMISPFKRKNFGRIQAKEIVLYESKQQDFYSVYVPLLRIPLTGAVESESLDQT